MVHLVTLQFKFLFVRLHHKKSGTENKERKKEEVTNYEKTFITHVTGKEGISKIYKKTPKKSKKKTTQQKNEQKSRAGISFF